jgi:PKD repeat protein
MYSKVVGTAMRASRPWWPVLIGLVIVLLLSNLTVHSDAPGATADPHSVLLNDRPPTGRMAIVPSSANLTLNWTNITGLSPTAPSPRASASMIYDSTDGYVVLFGGSSLTPSFATLYHNDTWTFLDGVWTNVTKPYAPSPRFGAMMADDPEDGVVLLFGGDGPGHGNHPLNDTWEFHAGNWTNVTKTVAPPDRFWGSMSWDADTNSVILFGGDQYPTEFTNDTWSFSGGNWQSLSPPASPPARDGQNQVWDPSSDAIVLFGGLNDSYDLNDTWLYANNNWTPATVPRAPDSRTGAGLAYDPILGGDVMYGGYPANDYPYSTWLFFGGAWEQFNTTLAPPQDTVWGEMVYDAADQEVVLFDTYEFSSPYYSTTWALTVNNTAPPPGLQVSAGVNPRIGAPPLLVTFNATASGGLPPYDYNWSFGNGHSSDLGNTTETYSSVGLYHVWLNVTDLANQSWSENWTVNVTSTPPPAFKVAPSVSPLQGVAPLVVTFNATATGGVPPYAFGWSFGNGNTSTVANTTEDYTKAGTYKVYLNASDDAGHSIPTDSWTVQVAAATPPTLTVTIAADPSSLPAGGGTVQFTSSPVGGVPPYTYFWTIGDNPSVTSRVADPSEKYPAESFGVSRIGLAASPIEYAVVLVLNDSAGHSARGYTNVSQAYAAPSCAECPGTANQSGSSTFAGVPLWAWGALAVIVVGLLVFVLFWRRRRNKEPANANPPSPPA